MRLHQRKREFEMATKRNPEKKLVAAFIAVKTKKKLENLRGHTFKNIEIITFWSAMQDYGLKLWENEATLSRIIFKPPFWIKTPLKDQF